MVKKRKKTKKLKKKKREEFMTGIFWLDCLIYGGLVVGSIKIGFPYLRSIFGLE